MAHLPRASVREFRSRERNSHLLYQAIYMQSLYLTFVGNGQMAHKLKHLIFSYVLHFADANSDLKLTLR